MPVPWCFFPHPHVSGVGTHSAHLLFPFPASACTSRAHAVDHPTTRQACPPYGMHISRMPHAHGKERKRTALARQVHQGGRWWAACWSLYPHPHARGGQETRARESAAQGRGAKSVPCKSRESGKSRAATYSYASACRTPKREMRPYAAHEASHRTAVVPSTSQARAGIGHAVCTVGFSPRDSRRSGARKAEACNIRGGNDPASSAIAYSWPEGAFAMRDARSQIGGTRG